MNKYTRSTNHN